MSGEDSSRLVRSSLGRLMLASVRQRSGIARLIGVVDSDVLALQHLLQADGLTPGQLAGRLDLSSAGTTALVARLSEVGLVTREAHPTDRRRSVLRPSLLAKRLVTDTVSPFVAEVRAMTDDLTPEELVTLERTLVRLSDTCERHADALLMEAEADAWAEAAPPAVPAWS